ncbi:indolepyruvate ferredoxin oxidoreductase family protein [Methylobacterium nonmethylotrophicum]|uniref:Indolepyruvate ferredoxin oxidoreductase family protein n=1 Tax=Methylobacterium nonmethylotrophicum TaxID=1141884 RepID=A0A4Z0NTL6_9HYPH|nr:indolepyruvate ferredoxin oxidoreductase family protein [Methylobacterium nonmethylotrophicum]TGD99805.1 indolepyruvate ferredoxin oxidoreductase family protein [Methylobacterium nonmethylotrophicum]
MGSSATTPSLRSVSLDDKYDLSRDQVFVTGTQAVIRMLLMQQARDRAAGLNTAGFVSGYRGSPLGGLDQNLVRAKTVLDQAGIVFQPGLNEELAATAIWGSQQAEMRGEGRYDGVFGLWYGKGPGVDRSGDVFRHANMAGTSRHGGVLALMGDDHTAESSTVAHQSEFHFVDVMSPILNPAGVQEILDYGLYGYAMSRYCGTWIAFKCVKENIESTASVDARLDRVKIQLPDDFLMPPGGLNIRTPDGILEQEARLQDFKRDAMLAFVRANNLNRIVLSGGRQPKVGIITVGKSYLDVRQAMDDLGLDEVKANDMGLRLYKVACPWPLSRRELAAFAEGLDLVMVVEEKRSLIEVQLREELYGTANQPVCIGKRDEAGNWLFPVKGALDPNDIAVALGERLLRYHRNDDLAGRVARLKGAQERLAQTADIATRTPHFCAGCPHNTSTKVPEGMRAYAGIGCHYMAQWMDRGTDGFTQMGGEGANWIGENAFSKRGHVFQNLGDGTYNHSGSLALRWAVDTGTTITYKILFNDAVAMTGGQPHEGALTVDRIAAQVRAEGVDRIALVTDEPDKYPTTTRWPDGLTIHHRDELDAVQRELATVPGVSVMIYDQTCASEKRRRRKRNAFPDPDKRVIINELVCEGCGDCSVQSNCVAVQPVETEFGRKRRIDQSGCNKDFSCVKGFCPSFVTVHGAKPRSKPAGLPVSTDVAPDAGLPEPTIPEIAGTYNLIVTGVGGTGVVTIGAILGMAAHLEGKGLGMIDMAGLAQKGGAVFSHVRLANSQEDIHAIRVGAGAADLVLGCDLVVSGNRKVLSAVAKGRTHLVVNTAEVMPGEFTRRPDFSLPAERIKRAIREAAGAENADFTDATSLAVSVLGNALAANMFMLGYAWQRGRVPLSRAALLRAIELNREAVAMNLAAFAWGRRAAAAPDTMRAVEAPAPDLAPDLDAVIAKRVAFLTAYQDAAYAERYAKAVAVVRAREAAVLPGQTALTDAAARSLFRLMAYKDEYEVARLYTDGSFQAQVARTFEGEALRYEFHLAPPLLARRDPATGRPRKMTFGPWMMTAFGYLARMKRLRGTAFDPFGYTQERREERRLVRDCEALLAEIARDLTPMNHAAAVDLAGLPQRIRGYGPVKAKNLAAVKAEEAALLARFRSPETAMATAAE